MTKKHQFICSRLQENGSSATHYHRVNSMNELGFVKKHLNLWGKYGTI